MAWKRRRATGPAVASGGWVSGGVGRYSGDWVGGGVGEGTDGTVASTGVGSSCSIDGGVWRPSP